MRARHSDETGDVAEIPRMGEEQGNMEIQQIPRMGEGIDLRAGGRNMTISRDFYLDGFYREDRGEDGAVFLRYSEADDDRTAEIRKTPMYYGGEDTVNFVLSVPKPHGKTIDACVAIVRTSKNNYIVTAFNRKGLITFKSESLNDVAEQCREFFNR